MALIGYHASHEQHPPSELLRHAVAATGAGFTAVSSSDHFSPWSERQGESGFAWSWLGAALAATNVPMGVVNAPGQRYHPAIVAQALATLAEMFPGRIWAALGTGEASNEHITGERWPDKGTRQARLLECVEVIRELLRGREVSTDGYVRVDRARLWTLPEVPPRLIGAALTEATARWCGGWADGLITVHQPAEQLRRMVEAFREGGGEGKPLIVQVKVAWASDDDTALAQAHDQWRTNVFASPLMADIESVEQFEVAATHVRPEDMHDSVFVSSDPGRHAELLHELVELGADELFVHQVPKDQDGFLEVYADKVLPELQGDAGLRDEAVDGAVDA
jgi:probable non-F420 flavinoid oxidoreductase